MRYFLVKEVCVDHTKGFDNPNIMFIGNEKAVIDFVNERTSDAYDFIEDIDLALKWLNKNGYETKNLSLFNKSFIDRLKDGEQIFIGG